MEDPIEEEKPDAPPSFLSAPAKPVKAKKAKKAKPEVKPANLKSAKVKKDDVVSDGSGGYFAKDEQIHLDPEIIDDLKKAGHVE